MGLNLKDFDFGGYATKSGLKCSDGRTILRDAFKANNGAKVPLVWQHMHTSPDNILGHAILENRPDGVYAYCKFNDTENGKNAKALVQHKDIDSLSIYANSLKEKNLIVHEGMIREVSIVISGANPGAMIDYLNLEHGDGVSDSEAIITIEPKDARLAYPEDVKDNNDGKDGKDGKQGLEHADNAGSDGPTVAEVFDTLNEEQKTVVYALLEKALETGTADLAQSNLNDGENTVKRNVFNNKGVPAAEDQKILTHDQMVTVFKDAPRLGSLKQSFLAHAAEFDIAADDLNDVIMHTVTYGIENIDYLFPDAKSVTDTPTFVQRDMAWVSAFMGAAKHTPFSRIKSLSADITYDDARARGYIKGNLKKEEFFALQKRVTTPTTVYKKQKLDRDDIVDITEINVVAWLKGEMRIMLDEEVARAGLLGDGRPVEVNGSANPDKIDETCIRPIYTDADLYVSRVIVEAATEVPDIIDAIIKGRKDYKGVGNPVLFTTTDFLTDMLLLKDTLGRRIYRTMADLMSELRVSDIVEVPVMVGVSRDVTSPAPATLNLLGILVNPSDYTYGADKGGQIGMFDDFDIDYNQEKYLMETRCSGALTNPKRAMIIEQKSA